MARRLTAKDLADQARLAEAVYRVLEEQRGRRYRSRRIQQLQRQLRKLAGDRAWSTYLSIEEAVNDRADRQLMAITRWAFRGGQRAVREATRRRKAHRA